MLLVGVEGVIIWYPKMQNGVITNTEHIKKKVIHFQRPNCSKVEFEY